MSKQYKNPPVVEVVCEFRFELEEAPNGKAVDLFFTKIRDQFLERRKGKINGVKIENDKEGQNINKIYEEFDEFISEGKKILIQLDKGRLSIHKLKPYDSWTNFFPLIMLAYNSYIGSIKIKSIQRAGLRYINNIEVPSEELKQLTNYFNLRLYEKGAFSGLKLISFMEGLVFAFNDDKDYIRVQLLDNLLTQKGKTFVLDMDYFSVLPGSVSVEKVPEWIKGAHENIEEFFEMVLTEKAKLLFD